MFSKNHASRLLILLSVLLLISTTSAAGKIEAEDRTVWLNEDSPDVLEVEASCEQNYTASIDLNGTVFEQENITSDEIREEFEKPGNLSVKSVCKTEDESLNDTESEEKRILLKKAVITVKEDGRGFVGEYMDSSDGFGYKKPVELEITLSENSPGSLDTLFNEEDFSFGDGLKRNTGSIEEYEDNQKAVLKPEITSYTDKSEIILSKEDLKVIESFEPEIIEWDVDLTGEGNPGTKLSFEQVENGDFSYDLDVKYRGESPGNHVLEEENFIVSVQKKVTDDGFPYYYEQVEPDDEYEEKVWMDVNYREEGPGNYRVSLSQIPGALKDLGPGTYKFLTYVRYQKDNREDVSYKLDEVLVEKGSEFSGKVKDIHGKGVLATLELFKNGDKKKITSDKDIGFSEPIKHDSYDSLDLSYYYNRDIKSIPSGIVEISRPDLKSKTDLGQASRAMRYHYWSDPSDISIEGFNPTDMMAVKFGYEIEGSIQRIKMDIDSGDINPENLAAYECAQWNFDSEECYGEWEKLGEVSDGELFISPNTGLLNINKGSLYTTPDNKDILMNAYAVGVPTSLTLKGSTPLSVSKSSLNAEEEFTVSGRAVSEQTGNGVKEAEVRLNLINEEGDKEKSFEKETDRKGGFEIKAKAPEDEGKYWLEIELEKTPFKKFSMESEKELEVDYRTGMKLETPEEPELVIGDASRMEFKVENTGQVDIEELSYTVKGLEEGDLEIVEQEKTVPPGEKATFTVKASLPEDYCNTGSCSPPIIELAAEGTSNGEALNEKTSLVSSIPDVPKDNNSDKENTSTKERTETVSFYEENIKSPVGNIVKTQSDVNNALTIVFVFLLVLAIAVKKKDNKKSGGRNRFREARQKKITKPAIKSDSDKKTNPGNKPNDRKFTDNNISDTEKKEEPVEIEEEEGKKYPKDSEGRYICRETGEKFDTKEGLDLYRQANNL